jgi:hypothetical protein
MISEKDRERYGTLARRIYAAWISSRRNHRSVDHVLRQYLPNNQPVGDVGIEIAKDVDKRASEAAKENLQKWQDGTEEVTPT